MTTRWVILPKPPGADIHIYFSDIGKCAKSGEIACTVETDSSVPRVVEDRHGFSPITRSNRGVMLDADLLCWKVSVGAGDAGMGRSIEIHIQHSALFLQHR